MGSKIPEKILFVDDDPNVLDGFQRRLHRDFNTATALGGEEGLNVIKSKGPFAVVIADMQMPKMNGVEMLAKVKEISPNSVRMMLTGNADQMTAIKAINEGSIFRFLTKPCPMEAVGRALVAGIDQYRLVFSEKELLEKTLVGSIKVISDILSLTDPGCYVQIAKIKEYLDEIASCTKMKNIWKVQLAASFSRLGFITMPPQLRLKVQEGEPLSEAEAEIVQQAPQIGQRLLVHIPRLEDVAQIIYYQSKRFDGSGFPDDSLTEFDIPMGSRLLKIITDLVQLETKGYSKKEALAEMLNQTGHYDPHLFKTILEHFKVEETIPTIEVGVAEIKVGDLLISNIESSDEQLLIAKGNRITPPILERLSNFSRLVEIKEPISIERTN